MSQNHAPRLYRQGDILLIAIPNIPRNARRVTVSGPLILAHGEATGHCHTIDASADAALRMQGSRLLYLEVSGERAQLRHPEHRTITLPRGFYEVLRQREYQPNGSQTVSD